MKEDETLTVEQVRSRERRKKLLLWQGAERQRVDRFVLVRETKQGAKECESEKLPTKTRF